MNRYEVALDALESEISSRYPARVTHQGFKLAEHFTVAERQAGIYCITSMGVPQYGYRTSASLIEGATHAIELVYQIQLPDNATAKQLQAAELEAVAEIEPLVDANLDVALGGFEIDSWVPSGGIEHPDAWVRFDLRHLIQSNP